MTIRPLTPVKGAAPLAALSLLGFSASCTQPEMLCDVGSGAYVVQYMLENSGADCLMLPGELIGMKTYNPPLASGKTVDASRTTLAVQPAALGHLAAEAQSIGAVDPDPSHTLYSLGNYSNKPNANRFCAASGFSAAEQHIPETAYTDAGGNAQILPETRLLYQWSDLRAYTTYAVPGTAATGEVTITKELTDPMTGMLDSCTVTYIANALYPAVVCEATDEMGHPTGSPDDSKCCAEPGSGRTLGSGINPDFKVKCHPALLKCVLDWRPGQPFPPLGANPACAAAQ